MLPIGILKKAIEEAEKSDMSYKMAAVIFKGNRLISYGHNSRGMCSKIHPKYRNIRDTTHAEQNAIVKSKKWNKLSGTSMLVIRITKGGNLSMALPCSMCMTMIGHVKIKNVYYSNHSGEIILLPIL